METYMETYMQIYLERKLYVIQAKCHTSNASLASIEAF